MKTKLKSVKTILQMIKEEEEEKKKKKTKTELHTEIDILWKYIQDKDMGAVCNELEEKGIK